MIEGMASQFVLLPDEFIQVFAHKNFAGRTPAAHQTK